MSTDEKSEVVRQILNYLTNHTEAQDTLEGIIQWWLLEERIKRHTETVKNALSELVARGLLTEHKLSDMRSCYAVNRQKMHEIRALLEQEPAG